MCDENLVKAENDKQIKYLDLPREVVDMWDVSTAIIVPIVVTANGIIAKSLDQHLRRLSLGGWIKGLIQKAVLLDTARIVRRFLPQEPWPPVAWTLFPIPVGYYFLYF